MDCRCCGTSLDRPGDYCLVCRSSNADTVVLELDRDVLRAVRSQLHYEFYRVADDDPIEAVLARKGDAPLEVDVR